MSEKTKPPIFQIKIEGELDPLWSEHFECLRLTYDLEGNTLLTGALPECLEQTIWMSNAWLLPARAGAPSWLTGRHPTLAVRVTAHPLASPEPRRVGPVAAAPFGSAGILVGVQLSLGA